LTKIAITQRDHGGSIGDDREMWHRAIDNPRSEYWANFKPVVDFIDCIGMFERDSIKHVPTLRKGLFCDVTHVKDVLAIGVDQELNWILKDTVEEKHILEHISEAKLLLNEFRGEPKVADDYPSTIPELKAAKLYLLDLFFKVDLKMSNFICHKIDYEARGSPCQLAACEYESADSSTLSWSVSKLTGDELLVGSLFGFGRKILGENSIIHNRDVAVVKVSFGFLENALNGFIFHQSSGRVQYHNDSSSDED